MQPVCAPLRESRHTFRRGCGGGSWICAVGTTLLVALILLLVTGCTAPRTTFQCKDRNALTILLGRPQEPGAALEWAELIDVSQGRIVWRIEAANPIRVTSLEFRPEQTASAPPLPARPGFHVAIGDRETLRLAPQTTYEFLAKGFWWESAARVRFRLDRCESGEKAGPTPQME